MKEIDEFPAGMRPAAEEAAIEHGLPVMRSSSMRFRRISRSIRLIASIRPEPGGRRHSRLCSRRARLHPVGEVDHRPSSSRDVNCPSRTRRRPSSARVVKPAVALGTDFVHGGAARDQFVDAAFDAQEFHDRQAAAVALEVAVLAAGGAVELGPAALRW